MIAAEERPAAAAAPRDPRATLGPRIAIAAAVALVAVLASGPLWLSSESMRLFVEFVCLLTMAQAWNLLAGYGGLVSIGQQAWIGIGGYALFVFANDLGLNPFASVVLAGLVAALLAIPTSRVLFRLSGGYFAVASWVVAEVYRLLVANDPALGSGAGISLTAMLAFERSTRENIDYWVALAMLVVAIGGLYAFLRSRAGLALTAIRDDAVAAESQGIDVRRVKFSVYVIAAFATGCAGALYFINALRISPDAAFGMNWIPLLFFTVIIGGIGTIEGPILGTLLYVAVRQTFSDYGSWYLIALGLAAIVIAIRFPRGLWGELSARLNWHVFPTRRRLRDVPFERGEATSA